MRARRGDEDLRRAFGARLRALRLARGFTLHDLARAADLGDHSHVVRLEQGHAGPALGTIARLCTALGVSADALIPAIELVPRDREDEAHAHV